ncbi:MAG: hypothetical protein WGN25_05295 [Candidatus Electrothrix sp. GW3-4]|uniref:hypothetical protein n=1 Tax=Candidatus Electrothrix sp. GW3-4 TaxID=3126740 RepID=UPI0030CF95E7
MSESTHLTDEEIFRRIILLLFGELYNLKISDKFISDISLSELYEFRGNSESFRNFCTKFNSIKSKVVPNIRIQDSEKIILTLEEIMSLRRELFGTYRNQMKSEIKRCKYLDTGKTVGAIMFNGLQIMNPLVSAGTNTFQILTNLTSFFDKDNRIAVVLNSFLNKIKGLSPFRQFAYELFNFQSQLLPSIFDQSISDEPKLDDLLKSQKSRNR